AAGPAGPWERDHRPPGPGEGVKAPAADRPEAGLDELAPAAGRTHVVATGARGAVEHGPQAVGRPLDRLECRPPVAETLQLVGRQPAKGVPKGTGPERRPSRAEGEVLVVRRLVPRIS